jgi:class 3 adenylate cyclase
MGAPSGTVTFLFTDIEGSTRLWQERAEGMSSVLARHGALLGEAIAGQGGVALTTGVDGLAAVFARAPDGVAAACQAQRLLGSEAWPDTPIRVRMALHPGEAEQRDGDYFGPTLNRCVRLMAAGGGGQVLCVATPAREFTGLLNSSPIRIRRIPATVARLLGHVVPTLAPELVDIMPTDAVPTEDVAATAQRFGVELHRLADA